MVLTRAVDHPTNTITRWCRLLLQWQGLSESALPTPGYLCGRGFGKGRCSQVLPLEGSKGHFATSDVLAQQIKFSHEKSLLPRLSAKLYKTNPLQLIKATSCI
jgi:hypothetical protein